MKAILPLLALLMVSCQTRPSATILNLDGSKSRISLGWNVMGEADEVLAEAEAPGPIHLRYAAKREDSTRVPIAGFQALVSKWLAGFTAHSQDLKTVTDGDVAKAGIHADVTKHLSDNHLEEVKSTFVPPP